MLMANGKAAFWRGTLKAKDNQEKEPSAKVLKELPIVFRMPPGVYGAKDGADPAEKPTLYFAMAKHAIFIVNQTTGK